MFDSDSNLVYTTDRKKIVEMARAAGLSDSDILRQVIKGEYGSTRRREIIIEWGKILGYSSIESLQLAKSSGLIPTLHLPKAVEKLRNIIVDTFDG